MSVVTRESRGEGPQHPEQVFYPSHPVVLVVPVHRFDRVRTMSELPKADEIVTLYYCPTCEMLSLTGDLIPTGHTSKDVGDQLECPRCHTRVTAGELHDYANLDVVDYE